MAPWFSLAGWGGLIIEHQTRQDGFRHLDENALHDVAGAVAAPPHFYTAKNIEDWNRHYLLGSDIIDMVEHFERDLEEVGLRYSEDLVKRFVASCLSKPFVILTGLTGSGKTKLAQAFAKWISPDHPQNLYNMLIPVGADWVGKENLLGYPDALNETKYVRTPLLEVLLHSVQEKELPHLVILDEMNLSHVERYFAEFLSAIESGEPIHLYSCSNPNDREHWRDNVSPVIEKLPPNLIIVGTVNVDETTYMFSPKVLDRAHTIEFRMNKSEVASFLTARKSMNVDNLSSKGASYGRSFVEWHMEPTDLSAIDVDELSKELQLFFDELSTFGSEFGFRVMNDIFRFIHYYKKLSGNNWNIRKAIDAQIYQKILPKLNGSQRRLQPILLALAILCYHQHDSELSQKVRGASDTNLVDKVLYELLPEEAYYPLSYAKVKRMLKRLTENGFTSFAEA
jgi:5-methylcytosine-specific restriction protein B